MSNEVILEEKVKCSYCLDRIPDDEYDGIHDYHLICKRITEEYQFSLEESLLKEIITKVRSELQADTKEYLRAYDIRKELQKQIDDKKSEVYAIQYDLNILIKRSKKQRKLAISFEKDSYGFSPLDLSFKMMTDSVFNNLKHFHTTGPRTCSECQKIIQNGEFFTSQKKSYKSNLFDTGYWYIHLQCFDSYLKKQRIKLLIVHNWEDVN